MALFGLTVSALMVARSQVAGDQLNLLARGWLLAFRGELIPVGMPMSGGGFVPGSVTSILVGLPLLVWHDHRAATGLIFMCHAVGYFLLDRMLGRILNREERLLFALFYWVNPWRIYHSGFLWTPNYLLFIGAVHAWSLFHQRRRTSFWLSLCHVTILGIALQIHPSAVLLVMTSLLLLWRGYFRLDVVGSLTGIVLVCLSLMPWLLFVLRDPFFLPIGDRYSGWSQMLVAPVLRGLAQWVRYPSLMLGTSLLCLDFTDTPGLSAVGNLSGAAKITKIVLGSVTVPVSVWTNLRLWRRARGRWHHKFRPSSSDRAWLRGFVRWSLVGSLATFALSPTTIMNWQVLAVLHVAVLPVILAGGLLLRSRWWSIARRALRVYVVVISLLALAMAFGSPPYRCSKESCGAKAFAPLTLRSDHAMLDDLAIRRTCPIAVNEPDGWWPDILPDEKGRPWYRTESPQTRRDESPHL